MKPTIAATLFLSLLFNSCGSSKHDTGREEQIQSAKERMSELKNPPPAPAPNTCRIVATVEEIDKTLAGTSGKDPCGTAPCMATVRIESVLAYGSSFPKTLGVGERIRIRFANTLNPTKESLPEIQPPLPGLRAGNKFVATVNGVLTMGDTPSFTVYAYEKK